MAKPKKHGWYVYRGDELMGWYHDRQVAKRKAKEFGGRLVQAYLD